MKTIEPDGFMLNSFKKTPTPKPNAVELVGPQFESGWDKVKGGFDEAKPIEKWNCKDIVRYFGQCYAKKFGVFPTGRTLWPVEFQQLEHIRTQLAHLLKLPGNEVAPLPIVKSYFEFFFDKYAFDIIDRRPDWPLKLKDAANQKYISSFMKNRPLERLSKTNAGIKESLSVEILEAAYKIHPQFFITNYGLIIPVNYLHIIKKMSMDMSVAYVTKAFQKIMTVKNPKVMPIVVATQKFQPYPKWLPFLEVHKITDVKLEISDDNEVFNFFRQ